MASTTRRLRRVRRVPRKSWQLIARTLGACLRYRVTGLAAEAAFFTVLSLPPLVFGLAGAIGFVAQRFRVDQIAGFRTQVLQLASQVLTDDIVATVIAPTLDDVLAGGRFTVISVGFVLSLWAGSRALAVFVETITIMYGLAGSRGVVKARALSFVLYLVFLLAGIVLLPLVLAGPGLIERLLPPHLEIVGDLYWPVVLLGSVCMLATLFHRAVPARTRWRADLPGAALTLGIWVGGGWLLRLVLNASAGSTTIYGPLAAPIALLIWLYLVSIAVLIGAAFNAALDEVWPRLSGIPHDEKSVPPNEKAAVMPREAAGPIDIRQDIPDENTREKQQSESVKESTLLHEALTSNPLLNRLPDDSSAKAPRDS